MYPLDSIDFCFLGVSGVDWIQEERERERGNLSVLHFTDDLFGVIDGASRVLYSWNQEERSRGRI